jgi:hypothetical protein
LPVVASQAGSENAERIVNTRADKAGHPVVDGDALAGHLRRRAVAAAVRRHGKPMRTTGSSVAAEGVDVELVRTNAPYRPAWVGRLPLMRAGVRLLPYLLQLWQAAARAGVMHILANSGWAWHLLRSSCDACRSTAENACHHQLSGRECRHLLRCRTSACAPHARPGVAEGDPVDLSARVFSRHGLTAEVIPNIIDLSRFAPAPPRSFGDAPQLVVTRNLEPIYDMPTAIHAFARIKQPFPQARLTLAGSGPELARLQRLVAELGLQDSVASPGASPTQTCQSFTPRRIACSIRVRSTTCRSRFSRLSPAACRWSVPVRVESPTWSRRESVRFAGANR